MKFEHIILLIIILCILCITIIAVDIITEEKYIFERHCVDEKGGIFNNEICTYERTCGIITKIIQKTWCGLDKTTLNLNKESSDGC